MAKKEKVTMKNKVGLISSIDLKSNVYKTLFWILFAVMVVLALICMLPPLWILVSSTKDAAEFYASPPTIIPRTFNGKVLKDIWMEYEFGKYYLNTVFVTVGSIISSVFFNGMAGYVLSKLKPHGVGLLFGLVMATLMVPSSVSMVTTYLNIIDFPLIRLINLITWLNFDSSLLDTFWPMWMMAGANAFMIIVYKSFFDGIPTSFIEAANLDGCSDIQVFFRIVLPLSKPVIGTSVILTMNGTWGDFFWPYMVLKEKSLKTVIVMVYDLQGWLPSNKVIVLLTFAVLPPIIIFCFFQKYIMQGFTMSGIKG